MAVDEAGAHGDGAIGMEEYGNVRVWWEPTDDRQRSGFAGAWWPAKVISRNQKKLRVKYDNGEEDEVLLEHVSPLDTLPIKFGEEEYELAPGEFCEVSNGSKTDPCAWLGRVVKLIKSTGCYQVEYPFHDAKPERIKPESIRRARIMEDGEWRLIKPKQEWEDGDVTSPTELELIHEDELWEYVEPQQDSQGGGAKRGRSAGEASDGSREIQFASSSSSSSSSSDDDSEGGDEGEGGPRKKRRRKWTAIKGHKGQGARVSDSGAGKAPPAARAPHTATADGGIPPGMLRLHVTVEPTTSGTYCLMPVPASGVMPLNALPVYIPHSNMAQMAEEPRAQLLQRSLARYGLASPPPPPSATVAYQRSEAAGAAGSGAGTSAAAAAQLGSYPSTGAGTSAYGAGGGSAERRRQERKEQPSRRYKTSWNCFVKSKRQGVAAAHPEKTHQEVLGILSVMWRALTAEERAPYEAESEKAKAAYQARLARETEELEQEERSKVAQASTNPTGATRSQLGAATAITAAPAPMPAAPSAPVPPRSAQQMYTAEFIKALTTTPGLVGPLSQQTALAAATTSWAGVDPSVRAKYEDKAASDVKRYEREQTLWEQHLRAAAAVKKAANKAVVASTAPTAAKPASPTNAAARPAAATSKPAASTTVAPNLAALAAKPTAAAAAPPVTARPAAAVVARPPAAGLTVSAASAVTAPSAATGVNPRPAHAPMSAVGTSAPAPAVPRTAAPVVAAPGAAAAAPAAAQPAAAASASTNGVSHAPSKELVLIDLNNVEDVLNKGIDLRAAERRLFEMGYVHGAFMRLVDAWRKDSPKVSSLVQLYKQHLHQRETPDWEAFMQGVVSPELLQSYKVVPQGGATQEAAA